MRRHGTVYIDRHPKSPLARYIDCKPDAMPELRAPLADLESRYDVLETFAEGGLATISIAQDKNLRRFVALKTLKPETERNPRALASFIAESKIMAQLDHPSILPVYGLVGDKQKKAHLCMKLVNGHTLRDCLQETIVDYKENGMRASDEEQEMRRRIEIFLRVCDAIAYAHARGIIHGDLKPENIVIGRYNEVYVVDWGLAKTIAQNGTCARATSISGTPRYFAPETIRSGITGIRQEIFTLGLILQEIVTLRYAVKGDEEACLDAILSGDLEPVRHLFGLPIGKALAAIIRKATSPRAEDRYQTAGALADDLRRCLADLSVSALPDGLFYRFARWTSRKKRECAAVLLAVLFVASAVTAAAVWRDLQTSRDAHREARAVEYISDRTATVAAHLDMTALQIQEQLLALARISAYLLAHNPGSDDWRTAFRPSLTEIGKSEKGMIYSPYYKRLTAMDYGIFQFAPDADRDKCLSYLRRTYPVLRKMRNIVLGSRSGYNFDPRNYGKLQMAYLYRGAPVRSVYVGTACGLKLLYPWRGNYPRAADPRKRAWYQAAEKKRGPVWGRPYMDFESISGLSIPCSVPIIDFCDRVVGVAGLDLSLNKLTERILSEGNVGDYVIEKAVVDRQGNVIFSSASEYYNRKFDPEKFHEDTRFEPRPWRTKAVRSRILASDYGTVFDGQAVYSWAALEVFDMVFVVAADRGKLLRRVESAP